MSVLYWNESLCTARRMWKCYLRTYLVSYSKVSSDKGLTSTNTEKQYISRIPYSAVGYLKGLFCRHEKICLSNCGIKCRQYSTTSEAGSSDKVGKNTCVEGQDVDSTDSGANATMKKMGVCNDEMESSLRHHTSYTRQRISKDDPVISRLFEGVKAGNRGDLAQSITLVESSHPRKKAQAQILLKLVMDHCMEMFKSSGSTSFRIGLSGPPGAGKSTHIEAVGRMLTARGHKVAVLAVDPSSSTTGGSLLGDKTRMPELSRDPNAYIRPSPAGGILGGVTRVTNEAIVLCEGAGYDIIIIETVGVGQSEFVVANMVDMFSLLIPPAGGDELQGIKKGIVEVADIVVVNKADGDLVPAARRIQTEYTSALKFIRPKSKHWRPHVTRVSSVTGEGLEEMWKKMEEFRRKMIGCGEFGARRRRQNVLWMRSQVETRMKELIKEDLVVRRVTERLERLVEEGKLTPGLAADILIELYTSRVLRSVNISDDSASDEIEEDNILRKFLFEFDKEIL